MLTFILRRLALLVPVLLGVSIVVFTLIHLIPGDAAMLAIGYEQRITPEQRELVRKSYGLDQSFRSSTGSGWGTCCRAIWGGRSRRGAR